MSHLNLKISRLNIVVKQLVKVVLQVVVKELICVLRRVLLLLERRPPNQRHQGSRPSNREFSARNTQVYVQKLQECLEW